MGSDRGGPSLVALVVIATGTDDTDALEGGLKAIEKYAIDYLAGPPDVTSQELTRLVEWTKAQRAMYRPVKLVRPWDTTGSDDMGIIELDETGMKDADGAVTAARYCARMAGILAGIPMGMSATYAALPELTAVTERTTEEQKTASRIKIVEGMDLISYYLRTTIENEYLGRYQNTYDNKQILVTAVTDYLRYLEQSGVLSPGESYAQVDYDRQLQWLNSQGVDTSSMTEQQVLEYQTGSWVFLRCGGRLVDALEDSEILFNNL